MTDHTHGLATVAITLTTVEELMALEFAFEGNLMPGAEEDAHDDELIATILGYHLRQLPRAPEELRLIIWNEFSERQIMIIGDPAGLLSPRPNYPIPTGVARPGYLLDSRGLDVDTLETLEVRVQMVASFADIAEVLFSSPIVEHEHPVIAALLQQYTDQQIIDLALWASFVHPRGEETPRLDYPEHVVGEIRARVRALRE